MYGKKGNYIKKYWVIITVIISLLLTSGGITYAAFVYHKSAKRVIATRYSDDVRFSSNILQKIKKEVSGSITSYICTVPEESDSAALNITISNYSTDSKNTLNSKDIYYKIEAKIVDSAGNQAVLSDYSGFKIKYSGENTNHSFNEAVYTEKDIYGNEIIRKLDAKIFSHDVYSITVPKLDGWDKYSLEIKAIPVVALVNGESYDSYSATEDFFLARKISFASSETPQMGWSGEFSDDKTRNSKEYYGFNYKISGGGQCTLKLSWNPSFVELNPDFMINKERKTEKETIDGQEITFKYIEFEVGHEELINDGGKYVKTSYITQFYRTTDYIPENENWDSVNNYVSCK